MCETYNTITFYIDSRTGLRDKVYAIQDIIDALELRLVDVAAGQAAVTDEYQLDDGQMRIRTVYRSIADVNAGIASLERLKQKYLNRLNGRSIALRDASKL